MKIFSVGIQPHKIDKNVGRKSISKLIKTKYKFKVYFICMYHFLV